MLTTVCTWTPATGYSILSPASTSGSVSYCGTNEYEIFSSIQSGITATSAAASKSAAMTSIMSTFH